jgi:hypothetical protein
LRKWKKNIFSLSLSLFHHLHEFSYIFRYTFCSWQKFSFSTIKMISRVCDVMSCHVRVYTYLYICILLFFCKPRELSGAINKSDIHHTLCDGYCDLWALQIQTERSTTLPTKRHCLLDLYDVMMPLNISPRVISFSLVLYPCVRLNNH